MTRSGKALYSFLSGFSIPAYDAQDVPNEATLPYITYRNVEPRWDQPTSLTATVWYPGTSYSEIFAKVDEIKQALGEGLRVPVDSGGCLWLFQDTPFAQVQNSNSDNVRAVYLMIGIHALCK